MREIDPAKVREAIESGNAIVCYSRCMWCGWQTPHEWCHLCTAKFNAGKRMRSDFWRFSRKAEVCELGETCSQIVVTR